MHRFIRLDKTRANTHRVIEHVQSRSDTGSEKKKHKRRKTGPQKEETRSKMSTPAIKEKKQNDPID